MNARNTFAAMFALVGLASPAFAQDWTNEATYTKTVTTTTVTTYTPTLQTTSYMCRGTSPRKPPLPRSHCQR